jgi:hypothetical protein
LKIVYRIGRLRKSAVEFSEWMEGDLEIDERNGNYIIEGQPIPTITKNHYQNPTERFPYGLFVSGAIYLEIKELRLFNV